MTERLNRSLDQVIDDFLWPNQGMGVDASENVRYAAVERVLRQMPEPAYAKLAEKVDEFIWFIPDAAVGAVVMPFPCTVPESEDLTAVAKVLYLGPALERRSFDFVVACVAHELAHIVLNHELYNHPDRYVAQEDEAWQTVKSWGFEHEERVHRKYYQKRESRERSLVKRLLADSDSAKDS